MRVKPYTATVEAGERADAEVAREAWRRYKLRNNSMIVDLFQGQYKSKLVCPCCSKVTDGRPAAAVPYALAEGKMFVWSKLVEFT